MPTNEITGRPRFATLPRCARAMLALAGTLSIGFTPSSARAGLTITCGPTYDQSTVTVGDVLTMATLLVVNVSDGTEGMSQVSISNIRHTPACGNAGAGTTATHSCDVGQRDAGVFTVSATAVGIAPPGPNGAPATATACIGRTFTVSVIDALTGEVLLTPDMPISLQPTGMAGSACLIQFSSIQVNKLPTHDVNPALPGAMTNQLCRVTVTQASLTITNGGLGQVTAAESAPKQRGVPAMSRTILLLAALALLVAGAFISRRRKQTA